ncbi:MAG TPA: VOC family protein [Caulobacteraceae bacterium]
MTVRKLAHYAVRARDLEASRRFYEELLQLRAGFRPPFAFPGVWLYLGDDETELGVVHLIGDGAPEALGDYLGVRTSEPGIHTGDLDHIAFLADDWPAVRARCDATGAAYIERTVPAQGLRQVFLTDPSGVTVELNFPA